MGRNSIDMALVPDLSWGHLKVRLNPEVQERLSPFTETLDRANGAFWFTHKINWPDTEIKRRESYLRASLAEYMSMEDTLPRDLEKNGISKRAVKIYDFQNPVLHIVRMLRNIEIHLRSSTLSSDKIPAVAGDVRFNNRVWFINDLEFDQVVSDLDNAQYYSEEDLRMLIEWFNDAQKRMGVEELIRRAVTTFARHIADEYTL